MANPTRADRMKVAALVAMRKAHRRTLQHSSATTYRKRQVATSPPPRVMPAALRYKNMAWLPHELLVPEELPPEAKLPARYNLPYYGLGKLGWKLYGRMPIDADLAWDPDLAWNTVFPPGAKDWGDPSEDGAFAQLRLQGPNPFLLKKVPLDPDADDPDDTAAFVLDFSELYDGIVPPVVARFAVRGRELRPTSIRMGDELHRPGDPRWDTAKRVVNGLDARYAAFIRHLVYSHLMVGEAYALAAYTLPVHHPLRAFMDFFSYAVLRVNHNAYKALLTDDSYFIRSNFVRPDDARRLIENATKLFDFDEWLAPTDIGNRGLAAIPGHPYVEDAETVWPAIEQVVIRHLKSLDYDDVDLMAADEDLADWYRTLRRLLPADDTIPPLDTVEHLVDLLTALVYNNVIHEVCGNLSPILDSRDPADKACINIDHLRALIDPHTEPPPPRAADVFLMDQASYVSTFNVAGNNLMTINAPRYIDDPKLQAAVCELQDTMRELDRTLAARNRTREIPFETMQPRKWEASVSF